MTETQNSPHPSDVVLLDAFVNEGWFLISVITDSKLIHTGTKKGKRTEILQKIEEGCDVEQLLKKSSPMGQPSKSVDLNAIEKVSWHDDAADLIVTYFDEKKQSTRKTTTNLSEKTQRDAFVSQLKQSMGTFEERFEQASIWYTGITQLMISGFALLMLVIPAIAMYFDPGPIEVDKVRRGAAIAALANAVGPHGLLAIAGAIIAAMMGWWYVVDPAELYRFFKSGVEVETEVIRIAGNWYGCY